MLDRDALVHLERVLREHRAPVVDRLLPGLTDNAIDELLGPVDVELRHEARELWRWHDGAAHNDGERSLDLICLGPAPMFMFFSLAEAIEDRSHRRAEAALVAPDEPDALFPARLLPIGWAHAIECGAPRDALAPVWVTDVGASVDLPEPRLASVGAYVDLLIDLHENSVCRFDARRQTWQCDEAAFDALVERHNF